MIALVIGHNREAKGAFSLYLNQSERDYNNRLVERVRKQIDVDVYHRLPLNGYNAQIDELARRVNQKDYKLVAELHFNAAVPSANGVEALHFHRSKIGKDYATWYCDTFVKEYGSRNRGAKPLSAPHQNGFGFVQKLKAPAIITEPFFGSNKEAKKFINVQRHADTLVKFLKCV